MGVFRKFPRTFWVANTIELFERWAWYGFFMLFANYLTGSSDMGGLEFTQSQKGILMGVGTGILYFLPVLTGAIADRYGYKKVLALAFVIYTSAFIFLPMFSTFTGVFLMYLYLALGAALFKPIISATIAKTTTDETASIGFGIYYMMVNIGAFFGPMVTLLFKGSSNLVFYVSAGIIALNFVLLLFYKEPHRGVVQQTSLTRTFGDIFRNMFSIVKDLKFVAGLKPDVSVLVATVRALKMHGGGPEVVPGRPLPEAYTREDLALLEAGCANLLHHAATIRKSGITPVVCINKFYTDTDAELELVRHICAENGLRCAVSDHWRYGGAGAEELARAVMEACDEPSTLKFLYPDDMPLRERVERIAREVYGADGVDWSPLALEKAQRFESDPRYADYCTMMVKTHLSLSHDPARKGVPTGWRLPVRDVLEYSGARFLCPVAGSISMMPGTGSDPAYRRIDVDTATGAVRGLF